MDPVAPATRRRMQRTAQKDNGLERSLRFELHRRGLRYRLNRRIVEGTRRTVDLVFPGPRVAVLIDGCFWHGCHLHGSWPKNNAAWWRAKIEANMSRDRDTDVRLKSAGWMVLRIWEHEPISDAATRIENTVRQLQVTKTSAR